MSVFSFVCEISACIRHSINTYTLHKHIFEQLIASSISKAWAQAILASFTLDLFSPIGECQPYRFLFFVFFFKCQTIWNTLYNHTVNFMYVPSFFVCTVNLSQTNRGFVLSHYPNPTDHIKASIIFSSSALRDMCPCASVSVCMAASSNSYCAHHHQYAAPLLLFGHMLSMRSRSSCLCVAYFSMWMCMKHSHAIYILHRAIEWDLPVLV